MEAVPLVLEAQTMSECGAEDDALVRDPAVPDAAANGDTGHGYVHPRCTLPAGHTGRFHQERRDGKVWAEWSGRRGVSSIRAPKRDDSR